MKEFFSGLLMFVAIIAAVGLLKKAFPFGDDLVSTSVVPQKNLMVPSFERTGLSTVSQPLET